MSDRLAKKLSQNGCYVAQPPSAVQLPGDLHARGRACHSSEIVSKAARSNVMNGPWGAPPPYRPPTPEQRAALAAIYDEVEAKAVSVGAACRACGQCCRFTEGGITLFASAIEMAYLIAESGPPPAEAVLAEGAALAEAVSAEAAADVIWRCPYQRENQCTARRGRTLGCRTYFCDGKVRRSGEGLYVETLRKIQRLGNPGESGPGDGERQWWYGPAEAYLRGCGNLPE
jgi:Fe-S-cluster containining protein